MSLHPGLTAGLMAAKPYQAAQVLRMLLGISREPLSAAHAVLCKMEITEAR